MKLEFSDEVEKLFEEISPYVVGCGKLSDDAPADIKDKMQRYKEFAKTKRKTKCFFTKTLFFVEISH